MIQCIDYEQTVITRSNKYLKDYYFIYIFFLTQRVHDLHYYRTARLYNNNNNNEYQHTTRTHYINMVVFAVKRSYWEV